MVKHLISNISRNNHATTKIWNTHRSIYWKGMWLITMSQILPRLDSFTLYFAGDKVNPCTGTAQMSYPGSSSSLNSWRSLARVSRVRALPSCSPMHLLLPTWISKINYIRRSLSHGYLIHFADKIQSKYSKQIVLTKWWKSFVVCRDCIIDVSLCRTKIHTCSFDLLYNIQLSKLGITEKCGALNFQKGGRFFNSRFQILKVR